MERFSVAQKNAHATVMLCLRARLLASLHLVEVSGVLVFACDHVKEDGNCGPSQLLLWDQSHLQDGTHHARDETDLMAACKMNLHSLRGKNVRD